MGWNGVCLFLLLLLLLLLHLLWEVESLWVLVDCVCRCALWLSQEGDWPCGCMFDLPASELPFELA